MRAARGSRAAAPFQKLRKNVRQPDHPIFKEAREFARRTSADAKREKSVTRRQSRLFHYRVINGARKNARVLWKGEGGLLEAKDL